MLIRTLANNVTELTDATGTRILVSYRTAVAVLHPDGLYERTLLKHSVTTQRHINTWEKRIRFETKHHKPQGYFDAYLTAL